MTKVTFFEKDGRLHFSIPEIPELEKQLRKEVKTQHVALGKKEFFFRRAVKDAANAIQTGQPRKYGTPIVEVEDPFTREKTIMTCQEAYRLLHDVGGNYYIRQIGGSPLRKDYFERRDA